MSAAVRLPDDQLETLADLIASRLRSAEPLAAELVDAATVAEKLKVARSWVYANAIVLGGRRIGSGAKPRLRFDLAAAQAAFTTVEPEPTHKPQPVRRRRRTAEPQVGTILKARPQR